MNETIISVGIDIGTSTTHLVFSEIRIENMASMASIPRIKIMDKRVIYSSPIYFTPLDTNNEIDGKKIRTIVEQEYKKANITIEQVTTGAVIITGESARKANAQQVVATLSGLAGEFVVATAGPALEGIIAGKGAHAHIESKKRGAVVANLDIGGGTTNIAVFKNGEVIDTSCLDIGGRLLQFSDNKGTISYISDKMVIIANSLNIPLAIGTVVTSETLLLLATAMAHILEAALSVRPATPLFESLVTDKALRHDYTIDYVSFSGGIADCLDSDLLTDNFPYGDMGVFLGRAIKDCKISNTIKILTADETIRATVVGAGSHTTNISGSTISIADNALPIQNIPVLRLSSAEENAPLSQWAEIIKKKLEWFTLKEEQLSPALAFKVRDRLDFDGVQKLAAAIIDGMRAILSLPAPLIVVVENDLAKALGQALNTLVKKEKDVICIDSIKVDSDDYIDIGKSLANGRVVPVIVKTLVFG